MNPAGSSASFLPVVMSPPGQAIEQHTGFTQVLFEGKVDVNDFPNIHICSLSQEPSVAGVHFDVRNEDGGISDQVFERSYLYRLIGTPGKSPILSKRQTSQQRIVCSSPICLELSTSHYC